MSGLRNLGNSLSGLANTGNLTLPNLLAGIANLGVTGGFLNGF
jgi:hypothetical protein